MYNKNGPSATTSYFVKAYYHHLARISHQLDIRLNQIEKRIRIKHVGMEKKKYGSKNL